MLKGNSREIASKNVMDCHGRIKKGERCENLMLKAERSRAQDKRDFLRMVDYYPKRRREVAVYLWH